MAAVVSPTQRTAIRRSRKRREQSYGRAPMRRGQFLGVVASALGLPTAARAARPVPQLRHLRASNGSRPFAGDTPMLATISPRRGLRDRALIRFTLTGNARVRLEAPGPAPAFPSLNA